MLVVPQTRHFAFLSCGAEKQTMSNDAAIGIIKEWILDFVKSAPLEVIRRPTLVEQLARQIVERLDQPHLMWSKWGDQREALLRLSVPCWIPIEDLQAVLNEMPGAQLSATDVAQRLEAMATSYELPQLEFQQGCLKIYNEEKVVGTELRAIIGRIRDYIDEEDSRLFAERAEHRIRAIEEERIEREKKLLSGSDCNWTKLRGSENWFCRKNGRLFRFSQAADKKWKLTRVSAVEDGGEGRLIGRYQFRKDATKIVMKIAYEPEPR